ncbi:uncharacterized protein LOC124690969 [Lolium rigidum]|uniref:uncharacterized protein LOC124690969 n=1 Tax=Lolium rigidum TaxID=89674 RepID=UPI001F5C5B2B|nr:uncharacterized protein LOC124690969 [Lolium rigidum]XP_051191886.1 uncharacterized protein LOC127305504 [Lolium perenne]
MVGACAVAALSPATASISSPPPPLPRSFRLSCRQDSRAARRGVGLARFSRDANDAKAEPGSKERTPQDDDAGYLWTLGLGSVGGAAAVKYGSVLLPDITRPNIVQALLMVSLPMVAAVLILLNLSSSQDSS